MQEYQIKNLEAIQSEFGFIVRPKGKVGTIGWNPVPWEAMQVPAKDEEEAILLARPHFK